MGKYIWIIRFVNEYEIVAADSIDVAYSIMREHIKSMDELDVPSKNDPMITNQEIEFNSLKSSYEDCLSEDKTYFGILGFCNAELIPLYSSSKEN